MRTLLSILLATAIFGGRILYLYLKRRRREFLFPVEAGPTSETDEDFTQPVSVRIGEMKKTPGLDYFLFKNECMRPIGICPGDIIGVQPFSDDFTIDDVEEGDVLLIELNDEKFRGRKIRVMDHADGSAFSTYYYVGNNKRQVSSKLHSFDSIRGVVREVNHPYQDVA